MSATNKARGDSVLKTLPEDRQAAIAEHAAQHKLAETVAWLRADGQRTSVSALSRWLAWYTLRQQLQRNETTVETLLSELPKQGVSPESIQEIGQAFFTALALQQQDPKQWFLAQQLALKKQQLSLDRDKFELLKAKAEQADKARATTEDESLTPEEKQLKLRQIFGMT